MKILVCIFLLLFTTTEIRTEDNESSESNTRQTLSSSASNLDENLRKALLKALAELENEDKSLEVDRDQILEKAQASSVSIFANSGAVSSTTFAPLSTSSFSPELEDDQETTTEKTHVLFQKSTAVNQKTITTVESDNEIDNEQILTSASNSFADQYSKPALNEKVVQINENSIDKNEKSTKVSSTTTTTTTALPTTSTEENEAKVEDVQFFSAPLVAAFTVHQDELGLPKSVEPIYKLINTIEQKNEQKVVEHNQNELLEKQQSQFLHQNELRKDLPSQQNEIQSQEFSVQPRQKEISRNEIQPQNSPQSQVIPRNDLPLRQKELSQNNHITSHNELQSNHKIVGNQQQFGQQNDLHSKLTAQESEIRRLNFNLKQQHQINQQQQQALLSNQQQQALLSNQQQQALLSNQQQQQQALLSNQQQQQALFNQQQQALLSNQQQRPLSNQQQQALSNQQQQALFSNQQQQALLSNQQQRPLSNQQQQALSNQQRQALSNQQQQALFSNQQQQALLSNQQRLNTKDTPFLPIVNPVQQPIIQQIPNREAELFKQKTSSVSLLPSLSFDPILEAGKLPTNGQILPIKGPINFHTPIIQTPDFQQYHSLSSPAPHTFFNFEPVNKLPVAQNFNQFQFGLPPAQGTRFFRQEAGVGNFGVNQDNSFAIQQSIQPPPVQNEIFRAQAFPNRFFRSNLESTFQSPGGFFQPPQNQNSNRFFRSNLESTFTNNNYFRPQEHNFNLNNLLLNSGAFQGRTEDFNIVSKVLSLNHLGGRLKRHKVPHY